MSSGGINIESDSQRGSRHVAETQYQERHGGMSNRSQSGRSGTSNSATFNTSHSPRSPRRRFLHRTRSAPIPILPLSPPAADQSVTFQGKMEAMDCSEEGEARAASPDADRKAAIKAEIAKEDAMIYLDGPQIYTCGHCRTHLTSHDDIISKSFHGRHGRAYLFDQCVNVHLGKPENRTLITGVHSVCDIFCDRCKNMVGWTYVKAYEPSQKYKEGKFIIEKINLHLEETLYGIEHPAGERSDRGRVRSMSWGSQGRSSRRWDSFNDDASSADIVYEYKASLSGRGRSASFGSHSAASPSAAMSPLSHRSLCNQYYSPRSPRRILQHESPASNGLPLAPNLEGATSNFGGNDSPVASLSQE